MQWGNPSRARIPPPRPQQPLGARERPPARPLSLRPWVHAATRLAHRRVAAAFHERCPGVMIQARPSELRSAGDADCHYNNAFDFLINAPDTCFAPDTCLRIGRSLCCSINMHPACLPDEHRRISISLRFTAHRHHGISPGLTAYGPDEEYAPSVEKPHLTALQSVSLHVNPGFARSPPRPLARRQGNRSDVQIPFARVSMRPASPLLGASAPLQRRRGVRWTELIRGRRIFWALSTLAATTL